MSFSKEEESVERVGRLFSALGLGIANLQADRPPRPDVRAQIGSRQIAIETTDYHGGERTRGGSLVRRQEEQDFAANQLRAYWLPADPLKGLVARIRAKVSKHYDVSATDEVWLAIFAGLPQPGATAATFLLKTFLNCPKLTDHTASLLEASIFSRSYILCGHTEAGQPKLYVWKKYEIWTEVKLADRTPETKASTFWEIRNLLNKK